MRGEVIGSLEFRGYLEFRVWNLELSACSRTAALL
jgi:hypothetical protein